MFKVIIDLCVQENRKCQTSHISPVLYLHLVGGHLVDRLTAEGERGYVEQSRYKLYMIQKFNTIVIIIYPVDLFNHD